VVYCSLPAQFLSYRGEVGKLKGLGRSGGCGSLFAGTRRNAASLDKGG
jgi:hypothetical protein